MTVNDLSVVMYLSIYLYLSFGYISISGGRIGPWIGQGAPDLRNLKLYFYGCEQDDICFVCSDGIHDNFDPQQVITEKNTFPSISILQP